MEDFESKRTIEEVLDLETGEIIDSKKFFSLDESSLIYYRRLQQQAINGIRKPKFICPYCYQVLKISGKSTRRGIVSFFSHLYDSEDCDIKTNGEFSKEEIEARKYSGVKESQRHIDLKNEIFDALTTKNSSSIGVENVVIEKRFESKYPLLNWRKPDIYSEFKGKKLVFELQLSTTFLSVVVSRDIFYRLNETFIIWVFNFSSNKEYVNIGNLMCKDIYYSNKRNAFIFDEEARRRTKDENELVLLCIWFEPVLKDGIPIDGKVIRQQKYVKLTDLSFDENTFKPYFFDADSLFFKYYPEQYSIRNTKENEGKKWLENIEEKAIHRIEKQKKDTEAKEKLRKERRHRIIKGIKNGELKLSPIKKKGKWGYETDGELIIPPVYDLAEEFSQAGFAKVKKNRKFGFIDFSGKEVVPIVFHEVFNVYGGACIGRISKEWFKYDISFGVKYKLKYDNVQLLQQGLQFLKVVRKETKKKWAGTNSAGWNIYRSDHYFYFGIIDFSGKVVIPSNYSTIEPFVNGQSIATVDSITGVLTIKNNPLQIESFVYDIKKLDESGRAVAKKNGLLGFVNEEGDEIIPCVFDSIPSFEEGESMVIAKSNNRLGVVDSNFNIIIPFEFDEINSFIFGKAKAQKDGLWGYIDEFGNELIPCIYDSIFPFEGGIAKAQKNGLWGLINESGKEVVPCIYEVLSSFIEEKAEVKRNELWGFIDRSYNVLIPCIYDVVYSFSKGIAKVKKGGLWGYIDEFGEEQVSCIYDEISSFENGRIKVQKNGLWGFVNELGEELIPCVYESISSFEDGKAEIKQDGKLGLVDESCKIIVPCIYETISPFNRGMAEVKRDGLLGCISESGHQIIPCNYTKIYLFISGRAKVQKKELWGYLDYEGNEITPCKWDWIGTEINTYYFSLVFKAYEAEEEIKKYAQLDDVSFQEENFIQVNSGNLWGGINQKGEQILSCSFEKIDTFVKGKAKVKKEGYWGQIDKMNNELLPCIYDVIQVIGKGKFKVQKNGLWGVIDESGEEIIEIRYDLLEDFKDERAKVKINGKWGYIDSNGNFIVKAIYDELQDFFKGYTTIRRNGKTIKVEGLARYKRNNKRGYVDANGKEYWQYWKDKRDFRYRRKK